MSPRSTRITLLAATWVAGCQCAQEDIVELDSEVSTSSSGAVLDGSSGAGEGTTSEPLDASRWIGRYHFENPFLPFGERGDTYGTYELVNFEILPDGRASMFYDDCYYLEEPITIAYEWTLSADGWLSLYPGVGETSLRYLAREDVETLRVQLLEPCRELKFVIDGRPEGFAIIRPGESCWVDRCTTYHVMQVDYCEGEEPPPCP